MTKKIIRIYNGHIPFILLIISMSLIVSCECTKQYISDKESINKFKSGFDSAYTFYGKLKLKTQKKQPPILEIEGSDYNNADFVNRYEKPINMDSCILYWDKIEDSLHFIKSRKDIRYYTDNTMSQSIGKKKILNLILFFSRDSLGLKTYFHKKYVLTLNKNCRFGVH